MPATGECCVCGKIATQRCSACPVDLFFCSTGHQTLVWFAHKPICGPTRCMSRHLPELDKFEQAEYGTKLIQNKYLLPRIEPKTEGGGTVGVEDVLGLPRDSFKKNVSNVNAWIRSLASTNPSARAVVLSVIREALHDMLVAEPGYNPLDLSAFAFASVLLKLFTDSSSPPMPPTTGLQLLQHATVWAGLARILDGRAPNPDRVVDGELLRANLRRLLASVKDFVDVKPGGNVKQIIHLFVKEFEYIPEMGGAGVHFELCQNLKDPSDVMHVTDVIVTRPGEETTGQRLAAEAAARGVPPFFVYRT